MVRDRKPSWMIPRFEGPPNEEWNSLFLGSQLGTALATKYWGAGSAPNNMWAGK